MRPIERGTTIRVFTKYQQARGLLIERLGEYCSYCETRLGASLAVEHVQPKDPNPHLELVWDNFLLACTNCNSIKGHQTVVLTDYFWADRDNTIRAFVYSMGGIIEVNPNLNPTEQVKAQKTMELVGLERRPPIDVEASDRRWNNRRMTWDAAQRSLKRLNDFDNPEMREQIVDTAKAQGFWSVWMTVFKDDPDMLERFIKEFPGTVVDCFDPVTFQPVPRVNGAI
jgi:uncharacterized protein (TIGR02646 family)